MVPILIKKKDISIENVQRRATRLGSQVLAISAMQTGSKYLVYTHARVQTRAQ